MKRVLLTGGTGFVGHNILERFLHDTDAEFVILDRLDFTSTLSRLDSVLATNDLKKRVSVVWHDLRAEVNPIVSKQIGPIDTILHLAASSHVDRSIEDPLSFVMDNVVGTCNLLNFARQRRQDLELFLYFSTDEVFGTAKEGVFFKEDDRYRSGNPYSASKSGAEELSIAFENTYKLPIVVTHSMNIFGIRQHPEKFIPLVVNKVLHGETIYIHADPTRTHAGKRHYIHTDDVADAMLFLLDGHWASGEKYNIVGEKELDNLTLAQIIANYVGKPLKAELVDFHSSRPGHDLRYALDGSKMRLMGWEPKKKVEERLKEVVEWYLANPEWISL